MRGKSKTIDHEYMKYLILFTDKKPKQIGPLVGCKERTVRVYAQELGSTRFMRQPGPPRVYSDSLDKGTYNYLEHMKAGFPENTRKNENLTQIRQQQYEEII